MTMMAWIHSFKLNAISFNAKLLGVSSRSKLFAYGTIVVSGGLRVQLG